MAYDPQRNRARAQPAADQPAPVDMVLEGTTEDVVTLEPVHVHGADCDHEHEHDHLHGPDLRLIVATGLATVAAAVYVVRRRRAARR